jgi:V8-like Glu-specific endopeptidase
MKINIFVFITFFSLLAMGGVYDPANYNSIEIKQYPFVVALGNSPSTTAGCTGILISEDIIITADHCIVSLFKFQTERLDIYRNRLVTDSVPPSPANGDWDGQLIFIESGSMGLSPDGSPFERTLTPDFRYLDYAIYKLLWFDGKKKSISPVKMKKTSSVVGDQVKLIGYPIFNQGQLTESTGEILSVSFEVPLSSGGVAYLQNLIVYNCSQGKQNSGGPLLDANTGELIGIASQSGETKDRNDINLQNHSAATPLNEIRKQSLILKLIESQSQF